MKTESCYGCRCDVEVDDDYIAEYCCSGQHCCCHGTPINPVFCNECEQKLIDDGVIGTKRKSEDFIYIYGDLNKIRDC